MVSTRILIEPVLETEVWRAGLLDDSLNHAVDGRIVPTLEARNLQRHQVGMSCRELRSPHFVIGAAGVRVLPGIAYVKRVTDHAGTNFFSEQSLQHIFV